MPSCEPLAILEVISVPGALPLEGEYEGALLDGGRGRRAGDVLVDLGERLADAAHAGVAVALLLPQLQVRPPLHPLPLRRLLRRDSI